MIEINNFDKIKTVFEDREILITKDYKSFSEGKDRIFVDGIFLRTDSQTTFGRYFPRREFFEDKKTIPLLATGFTKDLREYGFGQHASFIYDTNLSTFLNSNLLYSATLRQFVFSQEPVGSDPDAIKNMKAIFAVGHALVGVLEAGTNEIKGHVSIEGYNNISSVRDHVELDTVESRVRESLAALAAEELVFGNWCDGINSDLLRAGEGVIDAIKLYGITIIDDDAISFRLPGDRPTARAGNVVNTLVRFYLDQTRKQLSDKKDLIKNLADRLIEESDIQADRFMELMEFYNRKEI